MTGSASAPGPKRNSRTAPATHPATNPAMHRNVTRARRRILPSVSGSLALRTSEATSTINCVVFVVMTAVDGDSKRANFTSAFWVAIAATANMPASTASGLSELLKGPNAESQSKAAPKECYV